MKGEIIANTNNEGYPMKSKIACAALLLAFVCTVEAKAAPRDRATVDDAIDVLDDMIAARQFKLPPALLRDANAVIIAPDVVKGGFLAAARHGHGVLLMRNKDGWTNPIFI